ncbi:MAG: S1C family serine protease [Ardenticatenaceae bacterium]|nr:S1C family serine protease [Ardenticatenaceae bacterium]
MHRTWTRRTLAAMPPAAAVLLLIGVAVGAAVLVPQVQHLAAATATPSISKPAGGAIARSAAAILRVAGMDNFQALSPALVTVTVPLPNGGPPQIGSGFIWDSGGHIVTSAHLVQGARSVTVRLHDGLQASAMVRASDPQSNLAVLYISEVPAPLAVLPLGDIDSVAVGDPVVLLDVSDGQKVHRGTIRAVGELLPIGVAMVDGAKYSIPDVIATDLSVGETASGAPVLNERGEVIGVDLPLEVNGESYAVPISLVQRVIPALISRGVYEHPWLGLSGQTVTPKLAKALGLSVTQGVLILTVLPDSPAAAAGLRPSQAMIKFGDELLRVGGDVILGMNGQPVRDVNDLVTSIARYGTAGEPVTLEIIRDGQFKTVTVVLGARPSIPILD